MHAGNRARDWLTQAEDDLRFARCALRDGFYSQCCFTCQQVAEKALKAILYKRGVQIILTHSLVKLVEELRIDGRLRKAAGTLDQYYVSARYPDALPGAAPCETFTKEQAREALKHASGFVEVAVRRFKR